MVGKGLVKDIDELLYLASVQEINISEENPTYSSIDGNVYSKDGSTLIRYMRGKTATSFTISDSVTSIGDGAFYYCSSLTSVTIPDRATLPSLHPQNNYMTLALNKELAKRAIVLLRASSKQQTDREHDFDNFCDEVLLYRERGGRADGRRELLALRGRRADCVGTGMTGWGLSF